MDEGEFLPGQDHDADTDDDIMKEGGKGAHCKGEFKADGDVEEDAHESNSEGDEGIDKEVCPQAGFHGVPGGIILPWGIRSSGIRSRVTVDGIFLQAESRDLLPQGIVNTHGILIRAADGKNL